MRVYRSLVPEFLPVERIDVSILALLTTVEPPILAHHWVKHQARR
jgi:hypothetical protein